MEDKRAKLKDPFREDPINDVIAQNMKKRDEKRESQRERKRRQEERKQVAAANRKARGKIYMIVIVVVVVLAAMFSKSLVQIVQLKAEKEEAEIKLKLLEEHIERLEEEKARVTSDEYIEQQARQQLRMIYPGEVLYIMLDR
ncbi:MAG: septum formation initiator family protein [Clostridia bacterium]|nr:septum formation initiator family protein [Clostridia bacterium]